MFSNVLKIFIGTQTERTLKKLQPLVDQVNALDAAYSALTDDALKNKTVEFRKRLADGEPLDNLIPEAFAAVREASKRTIGLRHFDVQLIGGIVLHQGKIAEMRTGEGKTLVATLPVYLNALTGRGVHVVTVNDYLAKRDRDWMGPIYEFLGLTVGFVQHDLPNNLRQAAYASDVTYVTNNEVGFDYLRDNLVREKEERVLRPFNFAIVDEVDSILIDEARTPLIISGPAEASSQRYMLASRVVPSLKGRFVTDKDEIDAKQKGIDLGIGFDFIADEKSQTVTLTDQGITKCEKLLNVKSLYDDIQGEWVHHITQAIRAHKLYHRDVEYVVKDGEVIIVDEFTGRLMPGRRWSDGLHQAVEAKENIRIAEENQTLATITFQNFFRQYKKLAGMTGTALTEAEEFWQIYKLDVLDIPTHRPMIRQDHADRIFRTENEKNTAIVEEIEDHWKRGQPVLVGTRSIEKSEQLSGILRRKGVPHQVLNAKYHEQEAKIISQAGRKGAVTIATNMAGRGTDIVLGGNPCTPEEAETVKQLGGLHILGTERHESRRIDNQLRGRSGRQGDPGASRFYLALTDELMRLFGSERISNIMGKLGMQEGEDIQHPWVTKAIENAQRKVEAMNFDIRKQLLDFDNVMNKQREAIYTLRNSILEGEDITQRIKDMTVESVEEKIDLWAPEKLHPEEWEYASLRAWLQRTYGIEHEFKPEEYRSREDLAGEIQGAIDEAFTQREAHLTPDIFKRLERMVLLQVMDHAWVEHLTYLEQLRKGIFLRAYGQKDPLIEFQKEGFHLFEEMMQRIREEALEYTFKIQIMVEPPPVKVPMPMSAEKPEPAGLSAIPTANNKPDPLSKLSKPAAPSPSILSNVPSSAAPSSVSKLGRNDPCPCGSGKKYKKCCGK
ncbi:MAG TPA: preprotein translocase subunit SecA [Elusimicrobiota bacterium]|nr:preprotein translocase subunit SecA [Elusimicrobiota bacterium]